MAAAPPTRVAVVQLAYHPAAVVRQRSPLCDPLFDPKSPASLEPAAGVRLPEAFTRELRELRERVRRAHGEQIAGKAAAILAACRKWDVDLVVFPEYSLACEILPRIAAEAGDMVVVAGTHAVDQRALTGDVYRRLGCPEDQRPRLGEAVCPVLLRRRILALQPKLHVARPEQGSLRLGERWRPIDLPEETGVPGPLGALICLDFLFRESPQYQRLVAPHLEACTLLAVPSLTPDYTLPEFAAKLREEARRYKRPVAYANLASEGGTTIVADDKIREHFPFGAGELPAGDEGVIVVDVDLRPGRRGRSSPYEEAPIVTPFAEASLVYRSHPHGDAFAAWLETLHHAIEVLPEDDDGSALLDILQTVDERREVLRDASAIPGASARARRIAALLERLKLIHSAEDLACYVREVLVPPEILPFNHLREAMALGAHDVVHRWLAASESEVGEEAIRIAQRLRTGEKTIRTPQAARWTDAGLRAIEAVRQAVAGSPPAKTQEASNADTSFLQPTDHNVDGVRIRLRRSVYELVSTYQGGESPHLTYGYGDVGRSVGYTERWSERELAEVEELQQWLTAEGHTETWILSISVDIVPRTHLYVITASRGRASLVCAVMESQTPLHGPTSKVVRDKLKVDIDEVVPVSLLERRLSLSGFLGEYRAHALSDLAKRREHKLIDVDDHFEPPDVSVDNSELPSPALAALDAWIDNDDAPLALLLGEFGSGKSSLLTVWAERRWRSVVTRLPVLVPLLEAGVDESPTDLLLRALDREDTEVERARLSLLLRHRRLVPCFDGVDEVATRLDASTLRKRFHELAASAGPLGRVLIAARNHTFASDDELTRALPRAYRRLTLAPLSEEKVAHLIRTIRGHDADAVLRRLASTYDLADLVRRPLLLGMVLRSLDDLDPSARVGTADVYNAYIVGWLRGSHVGAVEALSDDAKIVFAEELAAELWRSGAPTCPKKRLRARILDVLRDQLIDDEAVDSISAYYEIQTGAFFVREGDDAYRFAHRSFLEFFLARGLVRHLESEPGRRLSTKPLTREVLLFVDQLLRREYGDPLESPPVQQLRRWLVSGTVEHDASRGSDPRVNAMRMLLHLPMLARHAEKDAPHDTRQWVPEGARLAGILLPREDLRHAQLAGVDLTGANLMGADLTDSILAGSRLTGARLRGCRLDRANLRAAIADGADLELCEADQADLAAARLSEASLARSIWTRCNWTNADLRKASTEYALILPSPYDSYCSYDGPALTPERYGGDDGHSDPPSAQISWSPCGQFILAVTYDGQPDHDFLHSVFSLSTRHSSTALESLQHVAPSTDDTPAVQLIEGPRPPYDQECFAWSPTESAVAWTTTDNNVVIFHPTSRRHLITWDLASPKEHPLAICWTSDGQSILVATRDAIRRQRISQPTAEAPVIADQMNCRHGGVRFFTRAETTMLAVFDYDPMHPSKNGAQISFFAVHDDSIQRIAAFPFPKAPDNDDYLWWYLPKPWKRIDLSPDGQTAVIALYGHLFIFDVDSGRIVHVEHDDALEEATRVAWSPTSDQVAVSGERTRIFHVSSQTWTHDIENPSIDLAWSPDGSMLATVETDGSILIRSGANLSTRLLLSHNESAQILSTPGGFFSFDTEHSQSVMARVRSGDATAFAPLGGLRRILHRPDRVQAALRGDLSQDDIRPALREAGLLDDVAVAEESPSTSRKPERHEVDSEVVS